MWLLLAYRPFNKAFATDIPKDFLYWRRQRKEQRLLFPRANPPQFPATRDIFPWKVRREQGGGWLFWHYNTEAQYTGHNRGQREQNPLTVTEKNL